MVPLQVAVLLTDPIATFTVAALMLQLPVTFKALPTLAMLMKDPVRGEVMVMLAVGLTSTLLLGPAAAAWLPAAS